MQQFNSPMNCDECMKTLYRWR